MATTTSIGTMARDYKIKGSALKLFEQACILQLWLGTITLLGASEEEKLPIITELNTLKKRMKSARVRAAFQEFIRTHPLGVRLERIELVDLDEEAPGRSGENNEREEGSEDALDHAISLSEARRLGLSVDE